MIRLPFFSCLRSNTLHMHTTITATKFHRLRVLTLRVTTISVFLSLFILHVTKDSDADKQIIVRREAIKAVKFLRNQEKCSNETFLIIYVHSKPTNAEKRLLIRNTWGSRMIMEKHKARIIFITGIVADHNFQFFLDFENELHKDIIQVNFTDSYRNLTYKAISGLKWVTQNCPNASFVLKTDDDIIVDINTVVGILTSYKGNRTRNLLACYIWERNSVDRNISSKWYTSYEEYREQFFLKYCSGSAFIMSYDVVKKFYFKSKETPFFWIDDYYVTGMLAAGTNVTPIPLNERYSVLQTTDLQKELQRNVNITFIQSPNTNTSLYVWKKYLERRL